MLFRYNISMSKINKLDSQIANMIAAGEVVERPSGVIKELIENSIDAGATRIVVTVTGGGIEKLTVEDNGSGMDATDTLMAFERHATSKIHVQNDLWNISTLGFRGEALPSIASVSKLTLVTSDGNDATKVVMEYGVNTLCQPQACPMGTSITVEGLFYRTPARLKHLRSANYEASLIQNLISSFALARPDIAFRFINEGKESFRSSGNHNLQEVIFQVYGRGAAENAIRLEAEDMDYKLSGYLIKPVINRSNRNGMHVYLNERMVRDFKLYQAIIQGYGNNLPQGRYPLCVINIDMDPHILDVNVHPSKWEVRLSKETQLEYLLQDEIQKVLQGSQLVKEIKEKPIAQTYYQPIAFEAEEMLPKKEIEIEKPVLQRQEDVRVTEVPVLSREEEIERDNEILREITQRQPVVKVEEEPEVYDEIPAFPELVILGQFRQSYVLSETDNGLVLIDQRRASMRIAYEKMLQEEKLDQTKQTLLVPIRFHTNPTMVNRIDEINEALKDLSISFEPFGTDTLLVREVPTWLSKMEEEEVLQDILDSFQSEKKISVDTLAWKQILLSASRHAMKKQTTLDMEQMKALVDALKVCQNPYVTPDGKPILVLIDEKMLLKEFGQ